jgi:hypothetical protein
MKQNFQNPEAEIADTTEGRDFDMGHQIAEELPNLKASSAAHDIAVALLLTGGSDRYYVLGLTTALISKGAAVDLIGSDELDCPEFHTQAR